MPVDAVGAGQLRLAAKLQGTLQQQPIPPPQACEAVAYAKYTRNHISGRIDAALCMEVQIRIAQCVRWNRSPGLGCQHGARILSDETKPFQLGFFSNGLQRIRRIFRRLVEVRFASAKRPSIAYSAKPCLEACATKSLSAFSASSRYARKSCARVRQSVLRKAPHFGPCTFRQAMLSC